MSDESAREPDPRLTAYVLHELSAEEEAVVEAEIAASPELAQEVAELRETVDLISHSLAGEPSLALTDTQRAAITADASPSSPSSVSLKDDPMSAESKSPESAGGLRWLAIGGVSAALLICALIVAQNAWREGRPVAIETPSVIEHREFATPDPTTHATPTGPVSESASSDPASIISSDITDVPDDFYSAGSGAAGPGVPSLRPGFGDESDLESDRSYTESLDVQQPGEPRSVTTSPQPVSPRPQNPNAGGLLGPPSAERPSSGEGFPTPTNDDAGDHPFGVETSRDNTPGDVPPGAAPPAPKPTAPSSRPNSNTPSPDAPKLDASESEPPVERPAEEPQPGTPQRTPTVEDEVRESEQGQGEGEESTNGKGGKERGSESQDGENGSAKKDSEGESDSKKPGDRPGRTWKRAKATPNASRLMIGDNDELPLEGMQVNVQLDGFRARVLLDLYYYNDRGQQLEGAFKIRLPSEGSLYYFAFGETTYEYRPMVDQLASNGFLSAELVRAAGTGPKEIMRARSETWTKVKEARMVPKEKAALAYSETVRRRVDPALVEWSGAGMFNAKVYPLAPGKLHRIVIGYDINLRAEGEDLVYRLDLPEHRSQCTVDIGMAALPGAEAVVSPESRPFIASGNAFYHFENPKEETVEVRLKDAGVMVLQGQDPGVGDFFATQITPDLGEASPQAGSDHAVFLVDTSLSSNPDKFNVWLHLLESMLTKNRDSMKEFAVLFFNIESHWYKNGYVKNTPENVESLLTYCSTLSLEGATDLRQAFAEVSQPSWVAEGEKAPVDPDLFLLSDGAATWGETNTHLILRALKSGSGGTLFAYNTGLTGTSVGLLDQLARETGGAVFGVATEQEVDQAALAHRSRPWRLIEAVVPGGEDLLIAGRVRNVYPGQTLLLTGRGKPAGQALLRLRRGDEEKTITAPLDRSVQSELAPRLYGQTAVGQLEELKQATENVSIAYARHFRVTGDTCSLLMLDSEADYQRFGIKPEDDQFVVKSTPAAVLIDRKTDEVGAKLSDPKASLMAWLKKMEQMQGFTFRTPTALQLALEQMPVEAFDVDVSRIAVNDRTREALPKKYFETLSAAQLDYDLVSAEAARRLEAHGSADAIKALSSLIENNPGDPVLTRDVAFSAMQWGLPGQAYPLLKRVAAIRPYEPQVYQAMAQCLQNAGNPDLALVYYEVALHGQWNARYQEVHRIVGIEYLHLLRRIASGELESAAPQYAKARLESLQNTVGVTKADLVVAMMWNTDRTDVDLHVVEPSGEEVFYKNRNSRAGGEITRDVTEGFGPEMYVIRNAAEGNYVVKAKFYGSDANRTQARTKVYLSIYEDFGGRKERVIHKSVTLSRGKEMREVEKIYIEKAKE